MFKAILHMVFGGTSAKALSDTRREILRLSSGSELARSEHVLCQLLESRWVEEGSVD